MKKEPVDIIILTYQRLYFLKEVIDEIKNRTIYPYRLIVVDNGSTDGTREWIQEMYKQGKIWKYVFTKENLFMTEAFTKGLELVESKYFITTQDDLVPPKVSPCWLTQEVQLLDKHKEFVSISMNYGNRSFFKYLRQKYGKVHYKQRKGNGSNEDSKKE